MNRLFFLLLGIFLAFSVISANADSWDDFSNLDRIWDGQKSITNQEFEQVMEKLEEKGKQKESKQKIKKRKKLFGGGTTLHEELNPDKEFKEFDVLKSKDEDFLLNVPVQIVLSEGPIEKGYYKVLAEKDEDTKKIYAKFYQSQFYKGSIEVIETQDDYGEEKLDFVKLLPYNESFMKLIYGSIDFNAYAYIPFFE